MIFKKKKVMSENTNKNANTSSENADNLTQDATQSGNNQNDAAENEGAAMVEVNEDKIVALQTELDEQKEKYLRLVAEFDNFRRRSRKEHYELEQTAGKDVITDLLVVLDDMDRAGKQMEVSSDIKLIKEGVTLVFNKMRGILLKKGLKVMDTKKEDFNPDLHEAITEIPVTDEAMQGMIIDVIEPGYYLNEKLIRCAKVIIGKTGELKGL